MLMLAENMNIRVLGCNVTLFYDGASPYGVL